MRKPLWKLLISMGMLTQASKVFAQPRFYEWHWEMYPIWSGAGAIGVLLLLLLFWVLVVVGFVVGLRWLLGKGRPPRSDSALTILRERYARGEINQEEFDQKKKDLA